MEPSMSREEVIRLFGLDPASVGIRNRGWSLIEELDDERISHGLRVGDLLVETRDGGAGEGDLEEATILDHMAMAAPNFAYWEHDVGDPTYVYYYFKRLS